MGAMVLDIPFTTTTDLRAYQNRVVNVMSGQLASHPYTAHGLLQTRPNSGEDGSARTFGRGIAVAGGAITKGQRVQVTSGGFCTLAASGDLGMGIAESTVASGGTFRGVFNFVGPMFLPTSAGV